MEIYHSPIFVWLTPVINNKDYYVLNVQLNMDIVMLMYQQMKFQKKTTIQLKIGLKMQQDKKSEIQQHGIKKDQLNHKQMTYLMNYKIIQQKNLIVQKNIQFNNLHFKAKICNKKQKMQKHILIKLIIQKIQKKVLLNFYKMIQTNKIWKNIQQNIQEILKENQLLIKLKEHHQNQFLIVNFLQIKLYLEISLNRNFIKRQTYQNLLLQEVIIPLIGNQKTQVYINQIKSKKQHLEFVINHNVLMGKKFYQVNQNLAKDNMDIGQDLIKQVKIIDVMFQQVYMIQQVKKMNLNLICVLCVQNIKNVWYLKIKYPLIYIVDLKLMQKLTSTLINLKQKKQTLMEWKEQFLYQIQKRHNHKKEKSFSYFLVPQDLIRFQLSQVTEYFNIQKQLNKNYNIKFKFQNNYIIFQYFSNFIINLIKQFNYLNFFKFNLQYLYFLIINGQLQVFLQYCFFLVYSRCIIGKQHYIQLIQSLSLQIYNFQHLCMLQYHILQLNYKIVKTEQQQLLNYQIFFTRFIQN